MTDNCAYADVEVVSGSPVYADWIYFSGPSVAADWIYLSGPSVAADWIYVNDSPSSADYTICFPRELYERTYRSTIHIKIKSKVKKRHKDFLLKFRRRNKKSRHL